MKNLKITFKLKTDLIAHRFLSIDSILLNAHYNLLRRVGSLEKDHYIDVADDLKNLTKWICVKNNQVSGSIWYIDKDEFMLLNNIAIRKTNKKNDILKYTGREIVTASRKVPNSGEFKMFEFMYETMQLTSVYFYVRGDVEYIDKLLKDVKYLGKKSSSGFGWVESYMLEEIEVDKSFYLNKTTPSKPLVYASFIDEIKTLKVSYYRSLPPYSEKKDLKLSLMPTTALYELEDNTWEQKDNYSVVDTDKYEKYLSNTSFLRNYLEDNTNRIELKKGTKYILINDDSYSIECACCGVKVKEGIAGNLKGYLSKNFTDFPSMTSSKALCKDCMWSMKDKSCKKIDYSFVSEDGVKYLYGQNMQKFEGAKTALAKDTAAKEYRTRFVYNLNKHKPPYSVNFNVNKGKPNHIAFKGKITLSSAYPILNYGDTGAIHIDTQLLLEALDDIKDIMSKTSLSKSHILNATKTHPDGVGQTPQIKKELNTLANRKIMSDFQKRYDSSIRRIIQMAIF